MISQQELQKITTNMQTDKKNSYREYAQHLFLRQFYKNEPTKDIFFKGGTALRLVYRSPRFSEDLDFSSNLQKLPDLEDILQETLVELEKENIEMAILESKETAGGYLGLVEFTIWDLAIPIKLEISYREKDCHGTLTNVDGLFIPPYSIYTLERVRALDQKVTALLTRSKPRDFYDIYFLLRANLLTSENKLQLQQINAVLQSTKIDFDKELKIFLPQSHWGLIENFKQILSDELKRYL